MTLPNYETYLANQLRDYFTYVDADAYRLYINTYEKHQRWLDLSIGDELKERGYIMEVTGEATTEGGTRGKYYCLTPYGHSLLLLLL